VTIKFLKRADIFEHHNFFAVTAGLVIGRQNCQSKSTIRADESINMYSYYIVLAKLVGTNLPDEKTDSQGKNVDHSV
jgi:hypothetical protein